MLKTKQTKLVIVLLIVSMVAMYGFVPVTKAASLATASDTIGDSRPSVSTSHVIVFQSAANPLFEEDFIDINFGSFTGAVEGNVTCPANSTATTTFNDYVGCVVDAGQSLASSSSHTITVTTVTNPGTPDVYDVVLATYASTSPQTVLETATTKVYVVAAVTVSATVDSTLTFTVAGIDADQDVNGVTTTGTSTSTTIPFGTIDNTASSTIGQRLSVSTNATDGFVVTVEQTGELANGAGANINSFNNSPDGTGSTSVSAWVAPSGVLDSNFTYGHMGVTSEDSEYYSAAQYTGLNGTAATNVLHHTGPANGSGTGIGIADVGYTVEISALQEAGDYNTTLIYIVTPTY